MYLYNTGLFFELQKYLLDYFERIPSNKFYLMNKVRPQNFEILWQQGYFNCRYGDKGFLYSTVKTVK